MEENKGKSSYDKIYMALMETEDGKALEEKASKALEEARVTGYKFKLAVDQQTSRPIANPIFITDFHEESTFGVGQASCSFWTLIKAEEFDNVAKKHFGVDIKTFFCLKETVFGEGSSKKKRGRKDAQSFHNWAHDYLDQKYVEKKREAQSRLNDQALALVGLEDFQKEQKEALVRFALDGITGILQRYAFLGEEVLHNALKEYITLDVMTS